MDKQDMALTLNVCTNMLGSHECTGGLYGELVQELILCDATERTFAAAKDLMQVYKQQQPSEDITVTIGGITGLVVSDLSLPLRASIDVGEYNNPFQIWLGHGSGELWLDYCERWMARGRLLEVGEHVDFLEPTTGEEFQYIMPAMPVRVKRAANGHISVKCYALTDPDEYNYYKCEQFDITESSYDDMLAALMQTMPEKDAEDLIAWTFLYKTTDAIGLDTTMVEEYNPRMFAFYNMYEEVLTNAS